MRIGVEYVIITLLASTLIACVGEKRDEQKEMGKSQERIVSIYVDTINLQKCIFNKQIICNGKLRAVVKGDISFVGSGVISVVNVKNGDNIRKGDVLAVLNTDNANIKLEQGRRMMKKANIDLADKLIGQGYSMDTTAVPRAIMNNVKNSSGYNSALDQMREAERNLADCYLKAPFSGRVANMDSKVHNRSLDKLCTLIDDSYFDVEFSILEAELGEVKKGQKVKIAPFIDNDKEVFGSVTEINPIVDEKGQIKIRAKVKNVGGYLLEGMNVKIVLNREIKDQFVVPKSAVVLRDGYDIIFRYIDGKAVWTYVEVVMSNIESHLITGHTKKQTVISDNDIIITSGNTNLADGTNVSLKN